MSSNLDEDDKQAITFILFVFGCIATSFILVFLFIIGPGEGFIISPFDKPSKAVVLVTKASSMAIHSFVDDGHCYKSEAINVWVCKNRLSTENSNLSDGLNSADKFAIRMVYKQIRLDVRKRNNVAAVIDIKALFEPKGGEFGGAGAECY